MSFNRKSLITLCLLSSISALPGCSVWETFTGIRVGPEAAALAQAQAGGAANCSRNEFGEIVDCCCHTACVETDDAYEFIGEFRKKLFEQVSDELGAMLGSLLEFSLEPAEACSLENGLEFEVVGANPARSESIPWEELASENSQSPGRKKVKALLNEWEKKYGPQGFKLKITLRTCPDASASVSASSCVEPALLNLQSTTTMQTSGGEPSSHTSLLHEQMDQELYEGSQCTTCEVPEDYKVKHELNWKGILE